MFSCVTFALCTLIVTATYNVTGGTVIGTIGDNLSFTLLLLYFYYLNNQEIKFQY